MKRLHGLRIKVKKKKKLNLNKQTPNLYQATRRHIPEDVNLHSICTNYCLLENNSDDRTVHWKAYRLKLHVLSSGSRADILTWL